MDLYATSYFDTSGSVGNPGGFILVQLSQSFEPNTTFHLEIQTVGGILNAKVLGTFKTGIYYIQDLVCNTNYTCYTDNNFFYKQLLFLVSLVVEYKRVRVT